MAYNCEAMSKIGECSSHASTFSHPQMTLTSIPTPYLESQPTETSGSRCLSIMPPRKLLNQLVHLLPHSAAPSKQGEGDSFQERAELSFSTFAVEDCLAQPPAI